MSGQSQSYMGKEYSGFQMAGRYLYRKKDVNFAKIHIGNSTVRLIYI
jgi:hypothetical protein